MKYRLLLQPKTRNKAPRKAGVVTPGARAQTLLPPRRFVKIKLVARRYQE